MQLDKKALANNFGLAASGYEQVAIMQKTVLERLIERLDYLRIEPKRILDLGSGTGMGSRMLTKRYPKAEIIQLDLSRKMLLQAKTRQKLWQRRYRYLCADQESLPIMDNSIDLVFSNLSLQWSTDFSLAMREISRVLTDNGLCVFSSLGASTLTELKQAWQQVDSLPHVNDFQDIRDIGDAVIKEGLSDPVLDSEVLALTYETPLKALKDLKHTGVTNVLEHRRKSLMGKQRFADFASAYEVFQEQGRYPVSYEIIYAHAWKPDRQNSLRDLAAESAHYFPVSQLKKK